jgi:hypothetical protein
VNDVAQDRPLKPPVAYGCFLHWPSTGEDWIAAQDRWIVRRMIPGSRIFLRQSATVDGWNVYCYGRVQFRAGPASWFPVPEPVFFRNDFVEIKSGLNQREPAVARIREVLWNQHRRLIEYKLVIAGSRQPRCYTAEELQWLAPLGENLPKSGQRDRLRSGGYL